MNTKYFFMQRDSKSCGCCILCTVLKKNGLPGVIFSVGDKGTSSKRILFELRKAGLIAVSKTISICNLRPWSILWYPPRSNDNGDHYVVVGEIADGKALIYDSEKKAPYWLQLSALKKKWYKLYSGRWRGWVIETKKPAGEK